MGGLAGGFHGGPEGALGGVYEVEGSGLADEGELIVFGVMLGEVFGAGLMRFFAHESYEVDGDRELGEMVFVLEEGKEHRGHGAFGIGGATAPDFAVAFFGGKGIDGHAVDGDGVEVRPEENAGSVIRTGSASDEIGAVRKDFVEGDGEAPVGEQGSEMGRHSSFARMRAVWNSIRIDRRDADKVLEKRGNGHFLEKCFCSETHFVKRVGWSLEVLAQIVCKLRLFVRCKPVEQVLFFD